nr:hypothetical protein [Photobacterium leiognathi]
MDPYTGDVTGQFARNDTLMQKVRKLHGELLLGKKGRWVIECSRELASVVHLL